MTHYDPLDDLASAHLDGQTTPAEAARIAADPELTASVERLALARDALRAADVPIDPARRDQAIAAAMAAFAEEAGDRSAPVVVSRTSLVPTAAAWRRPSRRTLGLVGIAAAVTLLALAVPLIDRLDSGANDDLAARLDEAADDMALRDAASGAADAAGDAAPNTALSAAPDVGTPDLGPFSSLPQLTDAVRSQLDAAAATESSPAAATTGPDGADAEPAAPCVDERAAGGLVLYTALADLDGQLVVILVREEADGGRTLVVLDRQDCSTVTVGRL